MTYRTALAAVAAITFLCAPAAAQTTSTAPAQATPPAAAPAPPKLTTIAKYDGSGGQVLVGAFIDNEQRVGVLGISAVRRASIALAKDEWASFLELWQQARAIKSGTWQTVGTVKETGLKQPSTLTVMGGPGVQFAIADGRGTFTVAVAKNDLTRLDASLHKVSLFLDGAAAEPDKPGASVRHHARRHIRPPGALAPARRCNSFWC
ncbi:MAG TPA: hypothetical protein VGX95_11065 [Xanthobacteraceae bacterium]|nr:hypothetical protein [Xanthobacteraceae bacterium]